MSHSPQCSAALMRPPFWLALLACIAIALPVEYLRFAVYHDRVIPLTYVLPLLVALWHRYRRLLWAMALGFTLLMLVKALWIVPLPGEDTWALAITRMVNLWLVAVVIHIWVNSRERIEQQNLDLAAANAELEAANEELRARDEEIASQNEELQAQTAQMEEQTEELEQQTEELRALNHELGGRERALKMLLESSRWLREDLIDREVLTRICQAVLEVTGEAICAAAIVEARDGRLIVRGHCGFGPDGPVRRDWDLEKSLAWLAMEQGRSACLADLSLRPDLETPQPADGRAFSAMLAAPLCVEGRVVGAIEVYTRERREWTEEDFRLIDWLAAHSSMVLESLWLQEQLEQRRREAEEESLRKTRFLAAVSHDVRTPANAINLMAELIARAAKDPACAGELPRMAQDLQANARSLIELVSDVLDLARFDSGRLDLQESEFPLASVVEAEVRQLKLLAQGKGLDLVEEVSIGDLWLRTDRLKLARVLGNLIGNAIKFTEAGTVRVQCVRAPEGDAEMRIIDTGVGISEDHLATIFNEFVQLRNPERDRNKGTGLGLAICKRLAEALGCSLSVRSAVGEGSTFTLSIPSSLMISPAGAVAQDQDRAGAESRGAGIAVDLPLAGLRILLVEDHDVTRRSTARLLAAEGAIVLQAENGREALQMLAHEPVNILLLDLMLPDIDGCQILASIGERRPAELKQVIVVSGDVTAARLQEVKCLGADWMMPKPIDIERLVKVIREAVWLPADAEEPHG